MGIFRMRNQKRNKFRQLHNNIQNNLQKLHRWNRQNYISHANTFYKKITTVELDITPTYYDLYNFTGTTYAVDTTSPSPASAYTAEYVSTVGGVDYYAYTFIYPTYGFAVPSGEDPEDYSSGATDWEFETSIAIIKSTYSFPAMPDWGIDCAKIICYLENEDGSAIGDIKYILLDEGQNQDEISVDFKYFYRWVKLNEGYELKFYSIFPLVENRQTSLNAKIYFYNVKNLNYGQSAKITK